MAHDRHGPDPDRLIVAKLVGTARRQVRQRDPAEDATAAAVAELREIAGGRADLLAEVGGVEIGFYSGRPEESQAQAVAELCIAAGADADQVAQWVEEGHRRAGAARLPPFSRPDPTPPLRS